MEAEGHPEGVGEVPAVLGVRQRIRNPQDGEGLAAKLVKLACQSGEIRVTYKDTKGEEVQDRKPELDTMNCPQCRGLTTRGALSNYGARCFRCFDAYCCEPYRRLEPSKYAQSVKAGR